MQMMIMPRRRVFRTWLGVIAIFSNLATMMMVTVFLALPIAT
jgi:hypothetical protein